MQLARTLAAPIGALLLAAAGGAHALDYVEELVTTARFGDIEFDSGRYGVYCPLCNGGQGNARFNWVDTDNNLWLGYIDPATGAMYPQNGKGVLVDTTAAYYSDFGNGPEWMWSQGDSQLVYTRYAAKASQATPTPDTTGVGLAKMVNGAWTAGFVDSVRDRILPGPSQSLADATPIMAYSAESNSSMYWRTMGDPMGQEMVAPWHAPAGLTMRWVPNADPTKNTTQLAFVNGSKPGPGGGKRYQQVYLYDTSTNQLQQITSDPTEKRGVFMFPAPEFGGDMAFITVANRTEMRVYRYQLNNDGSRSWNVVNRIYGPPDAPYLATPEQWVFNGRNYFFMTLSSSKSASDVTIPTDLAISGIDPNVPSFVRLTNQATMPRLRQDPEIYITEQGPFLYFSRAIPGTATSPPVHEGEFYINLQLGPPH